MAKGSVRKKGKKWYYRFYVEDASGKMVQKEYAGTESKSETEKLLRKALEDYENKKFVAKADSLTVGELLDMWAEEELKTGTLSNGTVENYLGAIRCIKKHPIADRKLKTVTAEHLQAFLDLLTFGGEFPDGKVKKGYSKDYIHSFSAVLQQSFRFAVFPKQLISFNPMQYIKLKRQAEEVDLFSGQHQSVACFAKHQPLSLPVLFRFRRLPHLRLVTRNALQSGKRTGVYRPDCRHHTPHGRHHQRQGTDGSSFG